MFFDHDGIKLEIGNRKKFWKFTNNVELNTLNYQQVKEEIRKIRKYFEIDENGNNTAKLMGYRHNSGQREIYNYKLLY